MFTIENRLQGFEQYDRVLFVNDRFLQRTGSLHETLISKGEQCKNRQTYLLISSKEPARITKLNLLRWKKALPWLKDRSWL